MRQPRQYAAERWQLRLTRVLSLGVQVEVSSCWSRINLPHFALRQGSRLTDSIAPSIAYQMTTLYVFVDDYLKAHPAQAAWRRSNNGAPAFTAAEVLTVGLLQGAFGCATLERAYQLLAANWPGAFPRLCSYGRWGARLHALAGRLIQAAAGRGAPPGRVYLVDGLPVRVCKSIRHGRVRLLHEDGAGFGKASTGWFFGFKLHALVHHSGLIVSALLTPASFDEREAATALALSAAVPWSVPGGSGSRPASAACGSASWTAPCRAPGRGCGARSS